MKADKLHKPQTICVFISGYKVVIYYFKNTCFFFFQRLVEAAEDAYLKHEFDADLQVVNNYFLKCLSSEYI